MHTFGLCLGSRSLLAVIVWVRERQQRKWNGLLEGSRIAEPPHKFVWQGCRIGSIPDRYVCVATIGLFSSTNRDSQADGEREKEEQVERGPARNAVCTRERSCQVDRLQNKRPYVAFHAG